MNIMKKIYKESDIRNDYKKLTKLLIERDMTITTMESATSGQIASLITDTEGSSAVLKGAFVTYCNDWNNRNLYLDWLRRADSEVLSAAFPCY